MSFKFITDKDKLIGSLSNTQTTVVKEFGAWIKGQVIDDLNYSQLEAVYSIPASISNPSVVDIQGVHLIDCRGVIIAERSDLSCADGVAVRQVVEELLDGLDNNNFAVVIESNRKNNKQRHDVDVYATHLMLGITAAFDDILCVVYSESVGEYDMDKELEHCLKQNQPIQVNFENGNTYKLLSISEGVG